MQRLIDGYYTVQDEELYALLALLERSESLKLEPSALAGVPGISHVLSADANEYRIRLKLTSEQLANATHLVWATGGSMVPTSEMEHYLSKGNQILAD